MVVSKIFALAVFTAMFVSCEKEPGPSPQELQALKNVKKVTGSADDHVQYQYNEKGHVTRFLSQWKDAAGNILRLNNVFEYSASNRLVKWSSEAGYGFYTYQNDQLNWSEHFASNNKKIAALSYAFGAGNQLLSVTETITDPLPGGIKQTRISYAYFANGNLRRMDFSERRKTTDPFRVYFIKKFVAYDDKKNPEPDGVLGAFLPGVTLLYNNPVRIENLSPDGTLQGYNRYEYTYNAEGLPVQRKQYIVTNNVEAAPVNFTYEY